MALTGVHRACPHACGHRRAVWSRVRGQVKLDAMPAIAATRPAESTPAGSGPRSPVGERGRYGVLLVATVLSLWVQGAVPSSDLQQVAVTGLAALGLLLAFRAARLDPRLVRAAALVGALALALSVARALGAGVGDGASRAMNAALVAFGPPAIAIGVLRDLRTSGQVRVQAVMGVLSLYMLLGMFFGFLYGAVDRFGGAPFFAEGDPATVSRCLYFSFTTLSTVGFGDLVARTDAGHTLSVFEALVGQIYLVTVVSVIVSNLGRPAARVRGGGASR